MGLQWDDLTPQSPVSCTDINALAHAIQANEEDIASKYTKPSNGISKSDLSSEVQTSLGKADTAIQDISNKQDNLVSGTNIKTINGDSILGSGDLTVDAGVTSVNNKTGAVTIGKSDVGLGDVDNTSDQNKPISTATQTELDKKQNIMQFSDTSVVIDPQDGQIIQVADGGFYKYNLDATTWDLISMPYDNSHSFLSATDVTNAIDELASEKQDKLVSGTNIKTIDNSSILGSGNISILDDIIVKSKNLYNPKDPTATKGGYEDMSGYHSTSSYNQTGYISVIVGEKYTAKDKRFVIWYDSEKVKMSRGNYSNGYVTVPQNVAYMRVVYMASFEPIFQVEKGQHAFEVCH